MLLYEEHARAKKVLSENDGNAGLDKRSDLVYMRFYTISCIALYIYIGAHTYICNAEHAVMYSRKAAERTTRGYVPIVQS